MCKLLCDNLCTSAGHQLAPHLHCWMKNSIARPHVLDTALILHLVNLHAFRDLSLHVVLHQSKQTAFGRAVHGQPVAPLQGISLHHVCIAGQQAAPSGLITRDAALVLNVIDLYTCNITHRQICITQAALMGMQTAKS